MELNAIHFIIFISCHQLKNSKKGQDGDEEEIESIENAAVELGFGPRVDCTTVYNFSAQRTICPHEHRDADDNLLQLEMRHLQCRVIFKRYKPLPEYRKDCPYVLVIVKGIHHHPFPLPSRAPPKIRAEFLELLLQFVEDLPDLTTRHPPRHPLLKSFLGRKLPNTLNPTLSDWHISLANRSHVKSFIDHVRSELFPKGTAWAELDPSTLDVHIEDEPRTSNDSLSLRFVVCMGSEGSQRLLRCQYVQSDIGFRRVTGFYEFELGGWDRDAQTSIVFCRIFITRQTAVAHQKIFEAIEDIVFTDTGHGLQWRHIHGTTLEDYDEKLLHWAADQHGGQAKGE
ncbi:hypothetical protein B0H14DRAFT_2576152 [Mycena olivaceomarginata]|nr:hypothetical protein B0H14DRAFT_2576152 [Mycena olivaceomarginata]